jgi:thiamine pyrophosphokinase
MQDLLQFIIAGKIINMENYVIVANAPFLPTLMITKIVQNKKIIALDGSARKLMDIGIKPHIILGDFDSLDTKSLQYWGIKEINENETPYPGNHDVWIVPAKDQNHTDLEKAICFCDQAHAVSIDIVCAISDNRLDLTLSNLGLLRAKYQKNRPLRLHTSTQTAVFVKDEKIKIIGNPNDYCGLFGFGETAFTSTGLKYNGKNRLLNFGFMDSVSNQLETNEAVITIKGEAFIIRPYSSESVSG